MLEGLAAEIKQRVTEIFILMNILVSVPGKCFGYHVQKQKKKKKKKKKKKATAINLKKLYTGFVKGSGYQLPITSEVTRPSHQSWNAFGLSPN